MTIRRKPLLTEILQALVREWGRETVLIALDGLRADGTRISDDAENDSRPDRGKRRSKKKLSAVELVAKTNQPSSRLELLMVIATKYDEKRFLPGVSDVREFLVMRGEKRRLIKDRSEGFRLFLEATKELPFDQLQHFATSSVFSGPSELAPLSDAISATGEARRQQTTVSEPNDQKPHSDTGHGSAGRNSKDS
jgi:hypothetical protein